MTETQPDPEARRSATQILFNHLPEQTVDINRGVWKVSRWRDPARERGVDIAALTAEVLAQAGPTVAVPIHWGTLYPTRLHHVWRRPLDEPGDRFAAHAASVAPEADVRVLRPGESTLIAPDGARASKE